MCNIEWYPDTVVARGSNHYESSLASRGDSSSVPKSRQDGLIHRIGLVQVGLSASEPIRGTLGIPLSTSAFNGHRSSSRQRILARSVNQRQSELRAADRPLAVCRPLFPVRSTIDTASGPIDWDFPPVAVALGTLFSAFQSATPLLRHQAGRTFDSPQRISSLSQDHRTSNQRVLSASRIVIRFILMKIQR